MKTEQRQRGNKRALVRQEKRQGSYDQGKAEIVPEHVVELIEPVRRMCGIPRDKIDKDAEAINVGDDAGKHDDGSLSPGEGHDIRHGPADEGMGKRTHVYSSH